jgi:adenylosuccinate synthase
MAIDPWSLASELDELEKRKYVPRDRLEGPLESRALVVSDHAHAILPYHVLADGLREQTKAALGTTKRGVGPCYEDKFARRGVRLGALRDLKECERLVANALEAWAPHVRALGGTPLSLDEVMSKIANVAPRIVPLLCDASKLVEGAVRAKKKVLFEGAQGTLLDIDHGTYPFVTSSHATAGGACTGTGVGPSRIDAVIGLCKAYLTRVGGGPFPTELTDAIGERLRKVGDEFGSVTGRPRRTGWLDLAAVRYAVRVNGLDGIALTKLDVLTGLDEIKVCTGYKTSAGESDEIPLDDVANATPIYKSFPGWKEDVSQARSMKELPANAQKYVRFIEEAIGCPIVLVSVGFRRDDTIVLQNPFNR